MPATEIHRRATGRWARNRWSALAASAWIQCASGGSYCFSVYSSILKSSQSYSQSDLDVIAFAKDAGANIGTLSGLLLGHTNKAGLVLLVGAGLCFLGYFPMWLAVVGVVESPSVWVMGFFMCLAAQGQTFLNTADVVTAVENFPDRRGTVIGIMKGFLGLSGAILVQIYCTLNVNPSSFILMLAVLPTFITLLLMYFVEVHQARLPYNKKFLDAFSLIAICIAGYLMFVIICNQVLAISSVMQTITSVLLLALLMSPLPLVLKAQNMESYLLEETVEDERTWFIGDKNAADIVPSDMPPSVRERENFNLLQAMCTLNFWLLFLAMSCGMGSGLATVNNISQIGGSLGYSITETSTLVSLWSIWNFSGRFGSGYISDYFLRTRCIGRPLFIAVTLCVMSIGHAIISSGLPASLYVGSVLVGLCYGSQWALMPSITSEIFGLEHFGTIFNTIAIASPVGSYVLSVRVVGYIYDMESSEQRTCVGKNCFALSFTIMTGVCLFGSAVAFLLFNRTRDFYREVVYARLQSLL